MAAVWAMFQRHSAEAEVDMKTIGGFFMLLGFCSLERGFSFGAVGALLLGLGLFGFSVWIGYIGRTRRYVYFR